MAKSMIENIPYWADLYKDPSAMTKDDWDGAQSRFQVLEDYYRGNIFNRTVDGPDSDGEQKPLLYPVGANLCKTLCLSMADSLFGEWDEAGVMIEPARTVDVTPSILESIRLTESILRASRANSRFWELDLDRQKFGGGILKINATMSMPFSNWSRIQATDFYPVVDPNNEDRFLAVKVVSKISKEQAKLKYGYDGDKSEVPVREIWDTKSYSFHVDDKQLAEYSGVNPFGVVPFVYIPRFRSSSWWGESLIDDIRMVQDELNMRLGDLGEAINYNAHPTRYGRNLPRKFNAKNYPLGANVMWDLGRAFSGAPEPEVGIMEAKNPVPSGTFEYIQWLYDWARTSVFAPPIAFGEDNGGGQRSGVTLEIRMWPLIKAVRRSRSYLVTGITNALEITSRILEQRKAATPEVIKAMRDGSIVPSFSSIMPRDKAALVDEVVKRLSTNPPSISLTEALKILGSPAVEESEIDKMVEKYGLNAPRSHEEIPSNQEN